MNKHPIGQNL